MLGLFLLVSLVQLFCWSYFFCYSYTPTAPGPMFEDGNSRVSVIVCFRNEEDSLQACIDRILAQSFPGKFELILVDDNSTDNSVSIVHPYAIRYDHVHLLEPGMTRPGKKDALAYGIERARYEHLLLTDADCVPASSHWLWLMTEPLRLGQELVLGVSPLFPGRQGGFLGYWQWFEATYVSLKYLGFAFRERPYMGVGRNLAYTKSFYRRAGGFTAHADLPSGDDDLLIAGNADPARTVRIVHPAAWTHTRGQPSWRRYFRQRGRHQTTGVRYPRSIGMWLGGIALSHGLFYLLGACLLFTSAWWLALGIYALRLLYLLLAYRRPLLEYDPGGYQGGAAGDSPDRLRDAKQGRGSHARLVGMVVIGDALVGPMYLYLALSGLLPRRDW